MEIDIRADIKATERDLFRFQRVAIPKATVRALNTTARNVRTVAQRGISRETGLKVGEVKENLWVRRATWASQWVMITARHKVFNLIRFVTTAKRHPAAFKKLRGVRARAWRKSKVYDGAFIMRGRGHGRPIVVKRTGKTRNRLRPIYGPVIDIEFSRPPLRALMIRTARQQFAINFERDLKFYISRIK